MLKPIATSKFTQPDVEDLTRDTRELMLNELIAITAKSRGLPIAMQATHRDEVLKASGVDGSIR